MVRPNGQNPDSRFQAVRSFDVSDHRQWWSNLRRVQNVSLVRAGEPTRLNPCVWKAVETVDTEQKEAADSR
jgi:hypothetical protein